MPLDMPAKSNGRIVIVEAANDILYATEFSKGIAF